MGADETIRHWHDRLIEEIEAYVNDTERRYAIALEGDWGSGKTRFVEQALKPRLEDNYEKDKQVRVIRVSMFGVTGTEDLFGRLATALFHKDKDEGGGKRQHGVNIIKGAAKGVTKYVAEKAGITLTLPVSMRSVVGILLPKKCLLVLDDVERRSCASDDMALFGAVNDMVESMGAKVMLVSTPLSRENCPEGRQFDSEIREKLVWRVHRFEPSPSQLAQDMLGDIQGTSLDVDTRAIVAQVAEDCKCRNARAMIRAKGVITELCSLKALDDEKLPLESREGTFRDAVRLALSTDRKSTPRPTNETGRQGETERQNGANHHEDQLDNLISAINAERDREHRKDFPAIEDNLGPCSNASRDEIEAQFRECLEKWYPREPAARTVKNVAGKLDFGCILLEDEEVDKLVGNLLSAMADPELPVSSFGDAIGALVTLDQLGFVTEAAEDGFTQCCREAIDRDVHEAIGTLSTLESTFSRIGSDRGTQIAGKLLAYARSSLIASVSDPSPSDRDFSGVVLAEKLSKLLTPTTISEILKMGPDRVAETFLESDAIGQEEMRAFINRFAACPYLDHLDRPTLIRWTRRIEARVEEAEIDSRMGGWRRKYFLNSLRDMLGVLEGEPTSGGACADGETAGEADQTSGNAPL